MLEDQKNLAKKQLLKSLGPESVSPTSVSKIQRKGGLRNNQSPPSSLAGTMNLKGYKNLAGVESSNEALPNLG